MSSILRCEFLGTPAGRLFQWTGHALVATTPDVSPNTTDARFSTDLVHLARRKLNFNYTNLRGEWAWIWVALETVGIFLESRSDYLFSPASMQEY